MIQQVAAHFMPTSVLPLNNLARQQESPASEGSSQSGNSNQLNQQPSSRVSPASTALVMSTNNINQQQPSSRQLTPSSSQNASSPSSGSSPSADSSPTLKQQNLNNNNNQHHHHFQQQQQQRQLYHHQQQQHHMQQQQQLQMQQQQPPNPTIRQFTGCHAKSMSAGVVVSVPGISNNLATAAGMNRNNVLNNNIVASSQYHKHQHRTLTKAANQNQQGDEQQEPIILAHNGQLARPLQHARTTSNQQAVIREHPQAPSHHRRQQSQPSSHQAGQFHHQQQQQQQQQHQQVHPMNSLNGTTIFDNHQSNQMGSSSIILNSQNIGNIHNRSASTHLSNVLMGPQGPNHHSHGHNQQQQQSSASQLTNSRHYPSHATNSIWSIDDNISKSMGKLTTSGYLPHSCLFDPSITDISCDNVSTASRLVDGVPVGPGYYLPHATGANLQPNSNTLSATGSLKGPEFLPICDLMFNLISMIIYFCENVFAIIALIAICHHTSSQYWPLIGALFILAANFICQYLSFRWHYKSKLEDCRRKREAQEELENEEGYERRFYQNGLSANMQGYHCGSCNWLPYNATELQLKFLLSIIGDAILHIFCLGFLARYIQLIIPITDVSKVKREARDLCMLRMIHGFVQSAPLLLLQAYVICSQTGANSIFSVSLTSAVLSLISVCWALASYTKYARKKYMHKFVLTWLGIVSQLLWRLGTISSRVVALTIYAVYYGYWMLVVMALHWLTMFVWLIKPGNLLRDETNMSSPRKVPFAAAAAWIYCFCYVNFEEHSSKLKMTSYYLIMFLENNLLLTVCLIFSSQTTWLKNLSILVVYLGFVTGMLFMFLYYKYFHIKVMNSGFSCSQNSIDSIADQLSAAGKKVAGYKPGTLRLKSEDKPTSGHRYNNNIGASLSAGSHPEIARSLKAPPYLGPMQLQQPQSGVFSCRSNPAYRKQKIPSSTRRCR